MQKINGIVAQNLAQRKYWLVVVQSQNILGGGGSWSYWERSFPPASPTGWNPGMVGLQHGCNIG